MNRKLKINELEFVARDVAVRKKSVALGYVLAILFGQIGFHRVYVGKVKTGLGKAILALITFIVTVIIGAVFSEAGGVYEIVETSLVQNTALALLFLVLILSHIVWTFLDLFFIPIWIDELNAKNEEAAIEKAIQSRYVEEKLLKSTISEGLLQELSDEIRDEIYAEISVRANDVTLEQLIRIQEQFEFSDKVEEEILDDGIVAVDIEEIEEPVVAVDESL